MTMVIYLLLLSMAIYAGMLLWFQTGNLFYKKKANSQETPPVSIIVAIRNGENSLPQLFTDLSAQNYSGEMEFILVDDESDDSTKAFIQEKSANDTRFIFESSINGDPDLRFKKRALDAGIKMAHNEWLLFTDADCRLKSGWVRGMAEHFTDKVDYVVGFSEVEIGTRSVTRFQSMDYFMLMTAARGTTNSGSAWGGSGQNQAFRKSLFEKVGGYSQIAEELQGDDTLFLQVCRKKVSAEVVFADNPDCRTTARQEKTWGAFLKQRARWAGDAKLMWKFNRVFFLSFMAAFLLPLLLISTLLTGLFHNPFYITVFVKFLTIQFILEFFLYFTGIRQLNKSIQIIDFILWFIVHNPYTVLMGVGSFFTQKLNWRGREAVL